MGGLGLRLAPAVCWTSGAPLQHSSPNRRPPCKPRPGRRFDLGVAFESVNEERLYPSVGFRTPDEEVRCVGALSCCALRCAAL